MKRLIFFLTLAIPSFATRYDCTWAGGGTAGVWASAGNWAGCNGTYPNNTGGDTYTAAPADAVTISTSITIGHSISSWQVTFNSTTDKITCSSASCTLTDGMIIEYQRQYTITSSGNYPTSVPSMARICIDNHGVSSPPAFDAHLDNCAAGIINIGSAGSGVFYAREYTPALHVLTPGSVTVDSGGTLRIQGDLRFNNPNTARDVLTINGGGTIIYDATAATNATITAYAHFNPSEVITAGARFRMAGSVGNLATLTSDVTGGAAQASKFFNGTYDGTYNGDMFLDYADVSCMGLSSGTAANQRSFWNTVATGSVSVKNSLFHACASGTTVGAIYWASGANGVATNQYVFEDSRWLDGVDNCSGYVVSTSNAPTGSGLRSFKRSIHTCRFGDANEPSMRSGDFWYNVFINVAPNMGAAGIWNSAYYNLAINSDVGAAAGFRMNAAAGGVVNVHHMMLYHRTGNNIRGMYPASSSANDQVLEYFYAAAAQGSGVSDGDYFMSSVGLAKVTLRNFISAPNFTAAGGAKSAGGIGTGGIVTPTPITPWTLQNGTWYNCPGRVAQGNVTVCTLTVSEAQTGSTGIAANYTGNLIYGDASFTPNAMHMTGSNASTPTNTLAASAGTFNGCFIVGSACGSSSVYFATNTAATPPWTGAAGVNVDNFGTHYDVPMTGGTVPGANDMNDVRPGYMAHRRTMETYVVSRGGTGTAAGVQAYWAGLLPAQLEGELTSAFTYLFYGWTPFNIRYAKPSSTANGKYIGAIRPSLFFGTF